MSSSHGCSTTIYAETLRRLLEKLYEDLLEAYHRTPLTVSSRPYIERGLRLAEAGVSIARALVRELEACERGSGTRVEPHAINTQG